MYSSNSFLCSSDPSLSFLARLLSAHWGLQNSPLGKTPRRILKRYYDGIREFLVPCTTSSRQEQPQSRNSIVASPQGFLGSVTAISKDHTSDLHNLHESAVAERNTENRCFCDGLPTGDQLVKRTRRSTRQLAEVFAEERSKLEKQWDRGDSVSTQDLRIALQRYRTFFQRLLSV